MQAPLELLGGRVVAAEPMGQMWLADQRASSSPRSLSSETPTSHSVPLAISFPEGTLQISLSKYRQLLPPLHKSSYQF